MRKTWGVNGEIKGTLKTKVGINIMYTMAKRELDWERERERERDVSEQEHWIETQ